MDICVYRKRYYSRMAAVLMSLLMIMLLTACTTNRMKVVPADVEYKFVDATEFRGALKMIDDGFEANVFNLRLEPANVPEGWDTLFSFVHASDVQIRDFGIKYQGEKQSAFLKKFAGGTQRIAMLDQNDEFPYLALVGAINNMTEPPRFLLHTGDSIDSGTIGELLVFVAISNHLEIPWFNAVGNHDILLFGNFTQNSLEIENPRGSGVLLVESRRNYISLHGFNELYTNERDRMQYHTPTEIFLNDKASRSFRHGFDKVSHSVTIPEEDIPNTSYYSVKIHHEDPEIRLIVLDTTVPDEQIPKVGKVEIPGIGASGTIGEDQFSWLESELNNANRNGEWVIIAGHHPLFDSTGKSSLGASIAGDTNTPLVKFLKNQRRVVAFLGGHTHTAYINEHSTSFGKFAEVIAPSLHEYPQLALMLTVLFNSDQGKLALLIQPVKGEVSGPLSDNLERACEGGKKEAKTNEDCWQTGKDVNRFIPLR